MNAALLLDNFNLLADTPNGIAKLRVLILDLAVRGRLVPQDPEDPPARAFLDRVAMRESKARQASGKTRTRALPPIQAADSPHCLPPTWLWVRLAEVVDYSAAPKVTPENIDDDSWLLDLEDIEKDSSRILRRVSFRDRQSKSTKARFRKGDVLYGKLRPYLNKVVVADQEGYCTTEIVPLRCSEDLSPHFLGKSMLVSCHTCYVV